MEVENAGLGWVNNVKKSIAQHLKVVDAPSLVHSQDLSKNMMAGGNPKGAFSIMEDSIHGTCLTEYVDYLY